MVWFGSEGVFPYLQTAEPSIRSVAVAIFCGDSEEHAALAREHAAALGWSGGDVVAAVRAALSPAVAALPPGAVPFWGDLEAAVHAVLGGARVPQTPPAAAAPELLQTVSARVLFRPEDGQGLLYLIVADRTPPCTALGVRDVCDVLGFSQTTPETYVLCVLTGAMAAASQQAAFLGAIDESPEWVAQRLAAGEAWIAIAADIAARAWLLAQ
jgi:hypothetical protein